MSIGSSLFGTALRSWFFEGNLYLQATRSSLSNLLLAGIARDLDYSSNFHKSVWARGGGARGDRDLRDLEKEQREITIIIFIIFIYQFRTKVWFVCLK